MKTKVRVLFDRVLKVTNEFLLSYKIVLVLCAFLFSFFNLSEVSRAADSYRLNNTQNVQITEHSVCRDVTNNIGADLFIPTRTLTEWNSFINNAPAGVTVGSCAAGNKLVFTTLPSNPNASGTDFDTQPVVQIWDNSNVLQTGATDAITLTAYSDSNCTTSSTGTLSATTNPLNAISGEAAFAGVQHDTAEVIYIEATATGVAAACIGPISIGAVDESSWTWVDGSNVNSQTGAYGTEDVAAATNVPGARQNPANWIDASGNLWLFGGIGLDSTGNSGSLNDLWKFDSSTGEWTWVDGSNVRGQWGTYGTEDVAAASNVPGGRDKAVTWKDASGNLWLFGGNGHDSSGTLSRLNDLWKFNTSTEEWTWVDGSDAVFQWGTYGTEDVAAAINVPGARQGAVSWIDASGNLWLFGGYGQGSSAQGQLNDLWKFDTSTEEWTWVDGSDAVVQWGTYGTEDVAAATNVPGGRQYAASWMDTSGNLWLFGGYGVDSAGNAGRLNDLWKFNTSTGNWTWVDGSNVIDQSGTYGTEDVAAATNVPGARERLVSWIDASENLWLFGGGGHDSTGTYGRLNDLWMFDPSTEEWTWVDGSNVINQSGTYGTEDVAAASNVPGARNNPTGWIDASGNLWLFGGYGRDSGGSAGSLNDLWKFDEGGNLYGNSTITGTGPVSADGTSTSTITISLEFHDGSPIVGVVPTFSATDTGGTNSYGTCTESNTSGVSTCTLASTYAEIKTLTLLTPHPVAGGTVTFSTVGATKLGFSTEPSNPNSLGVAFVTQPVVQILDASDDVITSATDSVTLAAYSDASCTTSASGTLSATSNPVSAISGEATFAGLQYDITGIIYIEATSGALTPDCIGPISIGPAGGGSISWTWLDGSDTTVNVSANQSTPFPGSREYTSLALAPNGDVWLFGGTAYDTGGTSGYSNELWKWNGSAWSFEKGATLVGSPNAHATYGNQGTAASANVPGGRYLPAFEADSNGNLWLFGGRGIINSTTAVYTNDVWKFDGTDWTWVAGANTADPAGTWVSQGTESASAVPGPRRDTASAMDSADNLWIFGGFGYDSNPSLGQLQDLWKFNTSTGNWTWVHGPSTVSGAGTYGTGGSSIPGSRRGARMVVDSNDDLWLYGGYGLDAGVTNSELGDLWKFDTTTEEWTWVSGPNTIDTAGSYGTLGEAGTTFYPGSRQGHSFGIDGSDNLYVFGGDAWDSSSTLGIMNDMWKYDPGADEWTWISGSNTNASVAYGTYGTQGVADENNTPGERERSYFASRTGENTMYLFGGNGYSSTTIGILQDLWEFSAGGLYGESTITGTGPVTADGTSTSTITITLKFSDGSPVAGVVPTFSATDTGSTNTYGTCSESNTSGVSTCTLSSTYAEVKTLSIVTPHSISGGTVTFDPGAAAQLGFSAGSLEASVNQNFLTMPVVQIQDAQGNPTLSGTDSITISPYTNSGCVTMAGGSLSATSNPINAVAGAASFTGVQYDTAGQIWIKASASGLSDGCYGPIDIVTPVAYVQHGTGTTGGSAATSISLAMPAGTTQDDVMIATICTQTTNNTVTPPAGWNVGVAESTHSDLTATTFYKVAGASESGPYSFSFGSDKGTAVIATYRNADTASPIDTTDSISVAATSAMTHTGVSVTRVGSMAVVGACAMYDNAWTVDSNMTARGEIANTGGGSNSRTAVVQADEARDTGSLPDRTFSEAGGRDKIGHMIILKP